MIQFDDAAVARYQELAAQVLRSGYLSEGAMTQAFESGWRDVTGLGSVAVSSGGFALWALLEAAGVRGHDVVVPTNTFMATPLAVEKAGGRVVYADCSRADLCLSVSALEAALTPETRAVVVVHVGGHLAFEIEAIAELCARKGLTLVEDCAHAHGATLHGRSGGSFGLGGAYSFYATKTLTVGEGGMLVSSDEGVLEFARKFRNYGKFDYAVPGFHGRLSELGAALGVVQLERFEAILQAKRALARVYDEVFASRVRLPAGMTSGYYKYVVFDQPLLEETSKVYGELCHRLRGVGGEFPESEWVAAHHACAPIWFGYPGEGQSAEDLRRRLIPDA